MAQIALQAVWYGAFSVLDPQAFKFLRYQAIDPAIFILHWRYVLPDFYRYTQDQRMRLGLFPFVD